MSNPLRTTLDGTFEVAAGAFEQRRDLSQRAAPSEAAGPQTKANSSTLVSLLAKTLGAGRRDWRQHRHAHVNYASSRVRYVEETMTADQAREFE